MGKSEKESKQVKVEVDKVDKVAPKKSNSELRSLIVEEALLITDGKPHVQTLMALCKSLKAGQVENRVK